jgi:ankyrin repeat protein
MDNYSCVKPDSQCNIIRPVSDLEFNLENPTTGKIYTEVEKKSKLEQYNNICNVNQGKLTKCCDPLNTELNKHMELVPKELREKYKKVKIEYVGNNKSVLKVCPEGETCPGYRMPTVYEYCKLNNATIDENNVVNSKNIDCYTGNCNILSTPFIVSQNDIDSSDQHLEDAETIRFIKDNDLKGLQTITNNNPSKLNRVLNYGFPGNTLLHEAIYRKSYDCIYYLLENIQNTTLEIKNQDGNTPIHIACLKKMKDIVNMLVKMGANVYSKNKYGDTPLMSAVRSGDEEIVRYLLVIGGGLNEVNELGENPVFVSVVTNNKNLNIIKILCENGANFLQRNNEGNSLLTELKKQENTIVNQEIETYLINKLLSSINDNNRDLYMKLILKEYPEFSPFEIHDKDLEKVTSKDYENIQITLDEKLDDTELYREKNNIPEKILPNSAKKYIEHFEGSINNKFLENRNMYLMIFMAIILVLAFFVNNYA